LEIEFFEFPDPASLDLDPVPELTHWYSIAVSTCLVDPPDVRLQLGGGHHPPALATLHLQLQMHTGNMILQLITENAFFKIN